MWLELFFCWYHSFLYIHHPLVSVLSGLQCEYFGLFFEVTSFFIRMRLWNESNQLILESLAKNLHP